MGIQGSENRSFRKYALAQKYDVDRVILFRSRARGDFRRTSDIDLAVEGEILSVLRWM